VWYYYCLGITRKIISLAVKDFICWRVLAAYSIDIHRRFTTPQTAIKTRNSFSQEYHLYKWVNRVCRNGRLPRNFPRALSSIKHQGTKLRRGFFIREYFSCDRREPNRVGKLFDAITLRVYKKITNNNTGKSRQHCAALKHYCLRLLPDLFHRMTVALFSFPASF